MLDHAVAVDEVELPVLEREPLGRVGDHQSSAVARSLDQIHAGDVELHRPPEQAGAAAADVEDPAGLPDAGQRQELRMAAASRPSGERLGQAWQRSTGSVIYARARHPCERIVTPSA